MPRVFPLVYGVVIALVFCWAAGSVIARAMRWELRRGEAFLLHIATGFALFRLLSLRRGLLQWTALALLLAAAALAHRARVRRDPLPPMPVWIWFVFGAIFVIESVVVVVKSVPAPIQGVALMALCGLLLAYSLRFLSPAPGVFASLATLAAPPVAVVFARGAVEAQTAFHLFAAFYFARLWREQRRASLLAASASLALTGVVPWLMTPHAPQPQVTKLLHFAVAGTAGTTVPGALVLLAPFALLAARFREGRWLAAAFLVAALPCAFTGDLNALVFAYPFLALALGMVFSATQWLIPAVLAFHLGTAWPPILNSLADPGAICFRAVDKRLQP